MATTLPAPMASKPTGELATDSPARTMAHWRGHVTAPPASSVKVKRGHWARLGETDVDEETLAPTSETVATSDGMALNEVTPSPSDAYSSPTQTDQTQEVSSLAVPALALGTSHAPLMGVVGLAWVAHHNTDSPPAPNNDALQAIVQFAKDNTVSQPKPAGNFAYIGTVPTQEVYAAAGIQGVVKGKNLEAINDALATLAVTGNSIDTVEKLQVLVNAYSAVIASTGNRLSASTELSASSLSLLGITSVNATDVDGIRASIAAQIDASNIDTIAELQALVDFYNSPAPSVNLTTQQAKNITNSNALNVSTATAGASLYYSVDGGAFSSTYTPPSTQGLHTVRVRQVSTNEGYLGKVASITFTYDTIAPADVDLFGHLDGVQTSDTVYVRKGGFQATDGAKGTPVAFSPEIRAPADTDIYRIEIHVTGVAIKDDALVSSGFVLPLERLLLAEAISNIGGVNNVKYSYGGTRKVLTLTKNDGSAFAGTEVQAIEKDLQFISASDDTSDRIFTFSHLDGAGNRSNTAAVTLKFDNTKPQGIDLIDGNGDRIDDAVVNFLNATDLATGKVVAPKIARTSDTDISTVRIDIKGAGLDTTHDQIVFGDTPQNSVTQRLDASQSSGAFTQGALDGISWQYTNKLLTFYKTAGGVFTADALLTLEQSLTLQTTHDAKQGDRSFTFSHIDRASNFSPSSTATVTVNIQNPIASAADAQGGLDVNSNEVAAAYLLNSSPLVDYTQTVVL